MKKLKIFFATLILFWGSESVFGQYTEVINSNKPGFSESPYSVGTGVYQFENSLFLNENFRIIIYSINGHPEKNYGGKILIFLQI